MHKQIHVSVRLLTMNFSQCAHGDFRSYHEKKCVNRKLAGNQLLPISPDHK